MSNYDFDRDFARERESMAVIRETILNRFQTVADVTPFEGDRRHADIVITAKSGKKLSVEIKEDFFCAKTGNVAIEISSRGKPSGLSVTRADTWLIIAHTKLNQATKDCEFFFIRPETLNNLIDENKYERRHVGGDPGSDTVFYLFNFKKLKVLKEMHK
jgi:hypothetical protein